MKINIVHNFIVNERQSALTLSEEALNSGSGEEPATCSRWGTACGVGMSSLPKTGACFQAPVFTHRPGASW